MSPDKPIFIEKPHEKGAVSAFFRIMAPSLFSACLSAEPSSVNIAHLTACEDVGGIFVVAGIRDQIDQLLRRLRRHVEIDPRFGGQQGNHLRGGGADVVRERAKLCRTHLGQHVVRNIRSLKQRAGGLRSACRQRYKGNMVFCAVCAFCSERNSCSI